MKILSPTEYFEKIKKFFDKKDLVIVITAAVAVLVSNINFLLSDSIAHDGLTPGYTYFSGEWELSLGRFLLPIMDNVRFGIVNKAIILFISALFLILGLVFLRRVLKIENKFHLFCMSVMVTVLPCFTEILYYTFCADSYFIAFFLSVLAVYFMQKKSYLFSGLCIIATAAIYQAFLAVTAGLIVVLAIKEAFESKDLKKNFKTLLTRGVVAVISLAVYYIAAKLICKIGGFEMASYKGANNIGLSTILSIPSGMVHAFRDFFRFYFRDNGLMTNNAYYRYVFYAAVFACVIFMIAVIIKALKEKRLARGLYVVLMLFALTLAVNITDVIAPESRMLCLMTCGQIAMIGLVFVVIDKLPKGNLVNAARIISALGLVGISWTFFLSNTYTQVLKNHTYERFEHFAGDVINRATDLEEYDDEKEWMISYELGPMDMNWNMANGGVSTEGVSWNWFEGLARYTFFFNKYYGFDYKPVDKEKYDEIKTLDEFKEMPVYPAKGSVKIIDNTVVVKTSESVYE